MRMRDGSSDVCSSDLFGQRRLPGALRGAKGGVAAVGGDAKATHRSARTCRYQTPDDDVFLQAVERVDLALDRRFCQHARGLLERRGRNERPGLERGLGDPEQHRLAVGKLAALGSGLGVDLVHLLRSEENTSELKSLMRI